MVFITASRRVYGPATPVPGHCRSETDARRQGRDLRSCRLGHLIYANGGISRHFAQIRNRDPLLYCSGRQPAQSANLGRK